MINYKWNVGPFECTLNQDGLEKIVTAVHWRLRGTDEEEVWAETYGIQPIGEPNPEAFTPFLELSQEQVVGWLETLIDVDVMKGKINSEITTLKTPATATLPAPWDI